MGRVIEPRNPCSSWRPTPFSARKATSSVP